MQSSRCRVRLSRSMAVCCFVESVVLVGSLAHPLPKPQSGSRTPCRSCRDSALRRHSARAGWRKEQSMYATWLPIKYMHVPRLASPSLGLAHPLSHHTGRMAMVLQGSRLKLPGHSGDGIGQLPACLPKDDAHMRPHCSPPLPISPLSPPPPLPLPS